MIFTNSSGNTQPYVSWKGENNVLTEKIPVNNRPIYKYDNVTYTNVGRANPIKHWRKQLMPVNNKTSCTENKYTYVAYKEFINDSVKITKYNQQSCVSSDPKSKVIKSAQMLTTPQYCRDTKEYLRRKCLTYEQRLSGTPHPNITYSKDGVDIPPSNDSSGTQVRNALYCNNNSCKNIIYKPNNPKFAIQGAVSSSSRLLRLKVDTINTNGNSFTTAWGQEAANAGSYHGTTEAPYFSKNKYYQCKNKRC